MAQPESDQEYNEAPKPFDEQTDRRIHEHLSNKNDVISEDDIRNIKTNIEENKEPHQDPENPIIENPEEKNLKDDRDPDVDTASWGILES